MNDDEPTQDASDPQTQPRDLRRDLGGLVLFALAIFLGVSVVMATRKPDPSAGGTTALVMGLTGLLGMWPLLVLSGCLGVLGARVWVAGAVAGLARNAAWSVALTLAFALLFGAASAGAGGSVGEFSGGNLTGQLSPWGGVPIALAVVAGVLWFAWLRPPEWKPVLSPDEPAPSIFTPTDSEGLTADEAEALLPDEAPPAEITGRSIAVAPDLPPLYPPDVRREGRIPEGARPLESRDEPAPRTAPDAPAAPALADAAARIPVQPLAEPARGLAHQAAPFAVQPPAQPPAALAGGSAVEDLAPAVPRWERPRDLAPAVPESAPAPQPPGGAGFHISVAPVRSAWETEEEDEELADEVDEEELVVVAAAVEVEDEVDLDEESELENELDDDEQASDEELDEESGDEEALEEDEEVEVVSVAVARVESVEVAEEAEDAEATAAELEEDEVDDADLDDEQELDEDGALAGDDSDEAWDDEEDSEVLAAAEDDAPVAAGSELPAEIAAAAGEPHDSADLQRNPSRPGWEQAGLFDDEPVDAYGTPMTLVEALRHANQETSARLVTPDSETEAPAAEPEPAAEPAEVAAATPEPELELQPQPRAASKPAKAPKAPKVPKTPKLEPESEPAAPVALDPNDDRVFQAGMLFLERGRVAVSMLQRTFDLDFKEATALLDQLQEAGLIGPYLGGQKRDILLTVDEWRERRQGAAK